MRRGRELVAAQADGHAGGKDLVVEIGDAVAHVAGDEVTVSVEVDLGLAAIGEELVVLALFHDLETKDVCDGVLHAGGSFGAACLREGVHIERSAYLRVGVVGNLQDLVLRKGKVEVELEGRVADGVDIDSLSPKLVCGVNRAVWHDVVLGVAVPILALACGLVVPDALAVVDGVHTLDGIGHGVDHRHAGGDGGDGEEQDHRDHGHREGDGVDLGRKLAKREGVQPPPIDPARRLEELQQQAREAEEEQDGSEGYHPRGDLELGHRGPELFAPGRDGEAVAQQAGVGRPDEHGAKQAHQACEQRVARLDRLVAAPRPHEVDEA